VVENINTKIDSANQDLSQRMSDESNLMEVNQFGKLVERVDTALVDTSGECAGRVRLGALRYCVPLIDRIDTVCP
jgi:hypothetical protein